MKFFDRIWSWWNKPKDKMHSGKCDLCDNQGIIWLDGRNILCWDHYCEEMQRIRKEVDREID